MKSRFTLALILIGCTLTHYNLALAKSDPASGVATGLQPTEALLASPARPDSDHTADPLRKPLAVLALAPVAQGAIVADLMPGSGYFTRLLSLETGSSGHVYAVVPAEMVARHPGIPRIAQAITANPAFSNISVVITPVVDFHVSQPLDLVWTSQNYHDVYGGMGPETALRMDRAIYQALKPGGIFMVIDHIALPGTGLTATTTLHRIDPELIIQQIESVGFQLETNSPVLRNPDDSHTLPVFDRSIRGHTDQIVLKFRKPLKQNADH